VTVAAPGARPPVVVLVLGSRNADGRERGRGRRRDGSRRRRRRRRGRRLRRHGALGARR
jgi:hypothetical protein